MMWKGDLNELFPPYLLLVIVFITAIETLRQEAEVPMNAVPFPSRDIYVSLQSKKPSQASQTAVQENGTKPDILSLIPMTDTVEGESQLSGIHINCRSFKCAPGFFRNSPIIDITVLSVSYTVTDGEMIR